MYIRILGEIGLVLDWDKNFSVISIVPHYSSKSLQTTSSLKTDSGSITNTSEKLFVYPIEHMALMPKVLIRQIMANSVNPMYFYTYSYFGEKDQYTIAIAGDQRFILFLNLLKVQQIGPKLACLVASYFSGIQEFFEVINKNDVKTLSKIPGLGNKKAGLIIWHFSAQGHKALLKIKEMQQGKDPYEAILNQLVITLNNLGIPKTQAKTLVSKHKSDLVKTIGDMSEDSELSQMDFSKLLRIVLKNK